MAGVDTDKAEKVSDEVIQLLIVARSLPDADFKTQLPDLEKTARKIVGDLTAAGVEVDEATVRRALEDQTVEARRQLIEAQS